MESKQRVRLWLGVTALMLWTAGFLFPTSAAASEEIDKLRREAEYFETKRDWAEACKRYWLILKTDRSLPEIKDQFQLCLRHLHQHGRHRDAQFTQVIGNLKLAAALNLYTDVLAKVQDIYVERDKVDLALLFRHGLEELRFALEDSAFLEEHLPRTEPEKVRAFVAWLEQLAGITKISRMAEARKHVDHVAQAAVAELGLNPAMVVLEFLCGAVNGLDQYTSFLTPAQIKAAQASLKSEPMLTRTVDEARLLTTEIGYLRLISFEDSTVQEIRSAILQLQMDGMKSLVLDLRGNLGGSFEAAVEVARLFLTEGVVVVSQSESRLPNWKRTIKAKNRDALTLPLVVLVDGQTASAAEVLAGALKENYKDRPRAILVGETTFGKGSVQLPVEIKIQGVDKKTHVAGMWITVARLLSPANNAYCEAGIVPHIVEDDMDRQLEKALMEAQNLLMMVR